MKLTARQVEVLELMVHRSDKIFVFRRTCEALTKKGLFCGNKREGWAITPLGRRVMLGKTIKR